MNRTFLAVPVPLKTKDHLNQRIKKVRRALPDWEVNWEKPEKLHVTLIFFGWTTEEQVSRIRREVAAAVKAFPAFEVSTGKISIQDRPIWFEIEKGEKELIQLLQILKEKLSLKGSTAESRPYHPHLTIGRVRKKGETRQLSASEGSFSWKADELTLYESELRRTGSIYTKIAAFPLKTQGK